MVARAFLEARPEKREVLSSRLFPLREVGGDIRDEHSLGSVRLQRGLQIRILVLARG